MGWDIRKGGHRYFTRSRRIGGRIVREYYGTGIAGQMMALEVERARRQKAESQRLWREWLTCSSAAEQHFRSFAARTRLLVRAALLAAGFNQHDRGEWRLRMSQTKEQPKPAAAAESNAEPDTLGELIALANKGDAKAQERLRRHVKANPGIYDGDLGTIAKKSWIALCAENDFMLTDSLVKQFEALHLELAGEKPSPTIRLLAEQVALAWMRAHFYDVLLGSGHRAKFTADKIAELQTLQMRAQQQYTISLKELEKVRQLMARGISPVPVIKVASPKRPRVRRSASLTSRMVVTS